MKRLLMMMLLISATMTMCAQKYYKCTGNNVNVRTGPGKNYAVMYGAGGAKCMEGRVQLFKGELVFNEGVKRNGFIKVSASGPTLCWEEGWVSAQYLKPATRCSRCNGRGTTGRVCPECNGDGYYYCCGYTGKEPCPKCGIIGYY